MVKRKCSRKQLEALRRGRAKLHKRMKKKTKMTLKCSVEIPKFALAQKREQNRIWRERIKQGLSP